MPIVRSYACGECFHTMTVTLDSSQWDAPPPDCPACTRRLRQEFRPVALGGSNSAKAHKAAETIAEEDYHVSDMHVGVREGERTKARYKDQGSSTNSQWGVTGETLQAAIDAGRQSRVRHGSGLDVLQTMLKSGDQADLIEVSKRKMREGGHRVW